MDYIGSLCRYCRLVDDLKLQLAFFIPNAARIDEILGCGSAMMLLVVGR